MQTCQVLRYTAVLRQWNLGQRGGGGLETWRARHATLHEQKLVLEIFVGVLDLSTSCKTSFFLRLCNLQKKKKN